MIVIWPGVAGLMSTKTDSPNNPLSFTDALIACNIDSSGSSASARSSAVMTCVRLREPTVRTKESPGSIVPEIEAM